MPAQCPSCHWTSQAPGPVPQCGSCGRPLPAPVAALADVGWYYLRDGRQVGPVPFDDLRAFAARGTLAPSDHVWQQGTPAWVAAGSVPGLFPRPAPAPAPPPPPPAPAAEPELAPYLPRGAHVRSQRSKAWAWLWTAVAVVINGLAIWYLSTFPASARAARDRQDQANRARAAWAEEVKAMQAKQAKAVASTKEDIRKLKELMKKDKRWGEFELGNPYQRDLNYARERLQRDQQPLQLPGEPQPPQPPSLDDVARSRSRALAFLLGCDLLVFPLLIGLQLWRWRHLRSQEIAYGVEWARFLARSDSAREGWRDPAARDGWAVIQRPDSPEHLRRLLALVPQEPKALYLALKGVVPRTWTLPPGKEAKELAADYLRFLVFRYLLALELPASSLGWGLIEGERAGIFRVDLNETLRLEIYVVVRVEGNVLSLLRADHVLWLYPEEVTNALACARRVSGSLYAVPLGAPQYLDVSYGHTAVWVRANVVRDKMDRYFAPFLLGAGLAVILNETDAAKALALVSKIEEEVENAMSEFTPTPELRAARQAPAPRPDTSW